MGFAQESLGRGERRHPLWCHVGGCRGAADPHPLAVGTNGGTLGKKVIEPKASTDSQRNKYLDVVNELRQRDIIVTKDVDSAEVG